MDGSDNSKLKKRRKKLLSEQVHPIQDEIFKVHIACGF